jgi:hypothetical protein
VGVRSVEFNSPIHDVGEQDQPGPGEWLAVARRIVTLGKGATAIVEKINTLTANADPPNKPPPRKEEAEVFVLTLPRSAKGEQREAA